MPGCVRLIAARSQTFRPRNLSPGPRRAGATGAVRLRADSGFYSWKLVDTLDRLKVAWSVTVAMNPAIRRAIAGIGENGWLTSSTLTAVEPRSLPPTYTTGGGRTKGKQRHVRLVVRRTKTDRQSPTTTLARLAPPQPSSRICRVLLSMLTVTTGLTPQSNSPSVTSKTDPG